MMRCAPSLLLLFSTAAIACAPPPAALAPTTPTIPLDLPTAASWNGVHVLLAVELGADGRLAVDGEQIASDEVLQARARLASTQHPELRAVIRADRHVLYERVIDVMDRLRQAGISRIAFAVGAAAKPAAGTEAPVVATPTVASAAREARPGMSARWACAFPPESDKKGIDSAVVTVEVSVNAAGTAVGVRVIDDPGNGFGRTAMQCALEQTYLPALDARGVPYLAVTPPFHVRFTR